MKHILRRIARFFHIPFKPRKIENARKSIQKETFKTIEMVENKLKKRTQSLLKTEPSAATAEEWKNIRNIREAIELARESYTLRFYKTKP